MFCEKCGAKVDDGQPFCPNCGNRMGDAAAPAAPKAPRAPRAPRAAAGSPLAKINAMPMLKKIFVCGMVLLLVLGMIMSWLKVFGHKESFDDSRKEAIERVNKSEYLDAGEKAERIAEINERYDELADNAHSHYYMHEVFGSWLLLITNILSTLAIAAMVLYLLGKFNDPRILLFAAGVSCLIFIMLFIKWLAGVGGGTDVSLHLSVAGWFMFLAEAGATALGILSFLEEKKSGAI